MRILRKLSILAVLVVAALACGKADETSDTADSAYYAKLRHDMVESQIVSRGISDRNVISAMLRVERHLFVPKNHRHQAYADGPLPIGENQTISQPYIVALMSELLALDSASKVLEIGTGSGYQAAILGEIVDSVFTIEIIPELADRAAKLLSELGYANVFVKCGDGFVGWDKHAPYDGIMVTCAPSEIPSPLLDQLADGGRLVIPVGTLWQELILVTKSGDELKRESIIPVRFVPMTGDAQKKK